VAYDYIPVRLDLDVTAKKIENLYKERRTITMNLSSRKSRLAAIPRRLLSCFLALLLLISGVAVGSVVVSAVSSSDAVNWCKGKAGGGFQGPNSECPSLIKAYLKQLWAIPYGSNGNGKDVAKNVGDKYSSFSYIAASNSFVPQPGDIISTTGTSSYGHVLICYETSGNTIKVIDQFNSSGGVKSRTYTVSNKKFSNQTIVGVARPKFDNITRPATPTVKLETPAVQQQGNAMKLSWSKVSGATSYRVDIRKQDNFTGTWRTVTGTAANGSQGNITSYSHATSGNQPGIYEFSVYSGNSAGQCTNPAKVTVRVNPAFPNAAPGFEDVTGSFVDGNYGKTIYLTNVVSACLVQNSSPSGSGNVIGSGNNKGSYERWKVVKSGNNVALQSVASGKYLVVGSATSAASASTASAGSQFHIYRNSANGYYYLRMSSGNYIAVDNGTKALRYTTTQPDATAGNMTWERFTLSVHSDYTTSAALEDGWYTIQGVNSGMYVSQSASYAKSKGFYSNYPTTENGQLYMAGTPSAGGHYADQYWYFQRQSDGTYRIRNYAISNLYMDVRGAWLWNGAEAIAYANSAQRWYVVSTGNGQYKLVNQITGGVLDVKGNGTANPTPLQQYVDNGTTAQRFRLNRVNFSISYDANGGVGGPAAQNLTVEPLRLTTLNLPTRTGYIFTGWSTKPYAVNQGNVQYVPGDTYTFTSSLTLYAVWRTVTAPSTYTVNYDFVTNGGTSATESTVSGLSTGASVDLTPTAVKGDGWVFVGWNTNKNATTALGSLSVNTSNITLYAIFSKTITATFTDAVGVQVANVTFYNNQTEVTIPTTPTQRTYSGWGNLGWIAGPELDLANIALPVEILGDYENDPVDPGEPVVPVNPEEPADLDDALEGIPDSGSDTDPEPEPAPDGFLVSLDCYSFYGLYERELTLSYDSDGGTPVSSVSVTQQVNSANLTAVESVEFIAADYIEKEGEIFKFWVTSEGEVVTPDQVITTQESIVLKAVWLEKYTITYSASGAEYTPEQQIKFEDMPIELSTEIPYKEGYTFLGWSISNGGDVVYEPFEEYLYEDDISLMLYAKWRQDADSTALNDTLLEALNLGEENDGKYTDASWATLQAAIDSALNAYELIFVLDETYSKQSDIDSATAAVRTALNGLKLAPTTFTLTLNPNGGTVTPPTATQATGTTYNLPIPTRSGYSFNGWALSGGGSLSGSTYTFGTSNGTATAQWTQNKGIFGTNAKWNGAWWHYLLFFFCFGFIWMWF